jgi:hypothetical protein
MIIHPIVNYIIFIILTFINMEYHQMYCRKLFMFVDFELTFDDIILIFKIDDLHIKI